MQISKCIEGIYLRFDLNFLKSIELKKDKDSLISHNNPKNYKQR